MRRWNGWGEEGVSYPVNKHAERFIIKRIGKGVKNREISKTSLLDAVGTPKIKEFPFSTTDKFDRLIHSFGQSFPDWLKFKMGLEFNVPDLVCYPENEDDLRVIIDKAKKERVNLIPYGGGTSVVGHLEVTDNERPNVSVDMSKMSGVVKLDEYSQLALIMAGTKGPGLEKALNKKGYTLGHFPQSFELSTLGGWVATRSSGQFSLGYGKIEDMFLGGTLFSPDGVLHVSPYNKSAEGVDLREIILGSEGRIGIVSKCYMKVSKLPDVLDVEGAFFPEDESGIEAVRAISQSNIPLTMVRLSLSKETEGILNLASKRFFVGLLENFVKLKGHSKNKCLMVYAISGESKQMDFYKSFVKSVIKKYSGLNIGTFVGKQWLRDRFRMPYLRNTLWDMGYGVDTLETFTIWGNVKHLVDEVEKALEGAFAFSHLSHIYPNGSSIYTTYIFPLEKDKHDTFRKWKILKQRASKAITRCGGVISHHHGIGVDHKYYLKQLKGDLGLKVMKSSFEAFDPYGIMNPMKLVD